MIRTFINFGVVVTVTLFSAFWVSVSLEMDATKRLPIFLSLCFGIVATLFSLAPEMESGADRPRLYGAAFAVLFSLLAFVVFYYVGAVLQFWICLCCASVAFAVTCISIWKNHEPTYKALRHALGIFGTMLGIFGGIAFGHMNWLVPA